MGHARALLVTLTVLALGLTPRGDASACENEVLRVLTPVEQVATAESELEHARVAEAAWRVRTQFPQIRSLGPNAPPLALRAARIYALALVRADGHLDKPLGWARWGNLEWALETLRELEVKRVNDPRAKADLAEARTRFARTRADGIRVLEDLDQRDLLGSPFAFLALARARRASGDDGGVQAALRRCTMMSNDRRRCVTDFAGELVADGS